MRKRTVLISTLVITLVGTAALAGHAGFSDVSDSHPHADGIHRAAEEGVIQGFEDGTFRPGDAITRAQAATMFGRFSDVVEERISEVEGEPGPEGPEGPEGPQGPAGEGLQTPLWDDCDGVDFFHNSAQCESFVQQQRTGAMSVAASSIDDVTEGESGGWEFYRVQTRTPTGEEFDVRDASQVLWLRETGQLVDVTCTREDTGCAEALYFNRGGDGAHDGPIHVYYNVDGFWFTIGAEFDAEGVLQTLNGDAYAGQED